MTQITPQTLEERQNRLQSPIISPVGATNSPIVFIGSCPCEQDEYSLEPFTGSDGQFLMRCMRQVGMLRNQHLFHLLFVQRPPEDDTHYFFDDKSCTKYTWEGREHLENLRSWLEGLDPKPNLLVALGQEALYALTGHKRLWKWRGSILPCTLVPGYKVYVTFDPKRVLRLIGEPEERLVGEQKDLANNALPLFMRDLERIRIQGEYAEIRYPQRVFDINLGYSDLVAQLERIDRENLTCSVDIETIYGPEGPCVWCVGFSPRPDYGFVVPFIRNQSFAWPIDKEVQLWILISKYFLNPKANKIFQKGAYDLSVLGRYYGLRVADNTYHDTMWLHHAMYPQLKKSLEILCSIYTWEPYYKDEGKVEMGRRVGDDAEFRYNAKDCCVTREIFPICQQNAIENGVYNGYLRSMSFMPSLLAMMLRGVKIDLAAKASLNIEFLAKASFHLNELNRIEGEEINLDSPKQLIRLLYYKHGYKEMYSKKSKTKSLTTDKDALNKLFRLYPNEPTIHHILEYRKYSKLASTYTEMTLDTDNRIRTSYGFVSTWRLYSSESAFGTGGNLQNIPSRTEEGRAVRRLFIPDSMPPYSDSEWPAVQASVATVAGQKVAESLQNGTLLMLAADLSQAEARVVSWEAEDETAISNFLDPTKDTHWENTKRIFKMPADLEYSKHSSYTDTIYTGETRTHYDFRRCGKTIRHAINYKMGPFQLQTTLAREGFIFDTATCKTLISSIRKSELHLVAWQDRAFEEVKSTRCLTSSFGRKRLFFGRLDDKLARVACAFSPQNTVGEILEQGIQTIHDQASDYINLLLNVHDEVVCQIPPHYLYSACYLIKKALEIPLLIHNRPLTIPCDFKAGPNWADMIEFPFHLTDNL